jgi:TFIIF-interacting CTD phosphatase-like protein
MHVYTMGTRAYAEEVCAAIDPGEVFFGGRILSRDESGSEFVSCPRHETRYTHVIKVLHRRVCNDCFHVILPWW